MNKTDRIISLGYNCEVSFRLEDYFGKLDSYLFSWSYECDRNAFVNALGDIDGVFSNDVSLMDDHMFRCNKYNIKFHPRYEILPKFGDATEEQIAEAKEELQDRLAHLKQKMKNMYQDEEPKVFLLKVEDKGEEDNLSFIKNVHTVLQSLQIKNFVLVAILEKKACFTRIKKLECDTLKIRTLKKFAHVKHTDILGDISGWEHIISEFTTNKSSYYRKNLYLRRKEVIPNMLLNKFKKIMGRH